MLKYTLTAAALATVLAIPAYAQSNNPPAAQPPTTAQSAPPAPAEKTAPPMNDKSSAMPDKAAVIGVGGFLGVGQKDVAVPFEALQIQRKQNSSSIDKITVSYTKDQLSNAPKFAYFQVQSNTTTGSAGSTGSPGGMSKPASPTGK